MSCGNACNYWFVTDDTTSKYVEGKMASRIIHLAVTNCILKNYSYKDKNRLELGCILPDAIISGNSHSVLTSECPNSYCTSFDCITFVRRFAVLVCLSVWKWNPSNSGTFFFAEYCVIFSLSLILHNLKTIPKAQGKSDSKTLS